MLHVLWKIEKIEIGERSSLGKKISFSVANAIGEARSK